MLIIFHFLHRVVACTSEQDGLATNRQYCCPQSQSMDEINDGG